MNYTSALNYIYSLDRFGGKAGLHRISALLQYFGNPQDKLNVIHIAGTNGKGSVAAMVSSALNVAGFKTGLCISPFIVEFCERIQVNGNFISKDRLAELTKKVKSAAETIGISLGQFEFITAVAFLFFLEEGCDYVVLETGLGGRFDATNIVKKPKLCIITSISLDHTSILGETVEEIAFEKAGIIKSQVPIITIAQPALKVISDVAANRLAPLTVCDTASNIYIGIGSTSFAYKSEEYTTSLNGAHQVENATLAIEALKLLGINEKYIKEGLNNAKHLARLEIISKNPLVILDGAHNEGGAEALSEYLKAINFKGTAIVGAMADKDAKTVAKKISPYLNNIITVAVNNNPRSLSAEKLRGYFSDLVEHSETAENYLEALNMCEGPLLVCGSLYLASDIRPKLLQKYK